MLGRAHHGDAPRAAPFAAHAAPRCNHWAGLPQRLWHCNLLVEVAAVLQPLQKIQINHTAQCYPPAGAFFCNYWRPRGCTGPLLTGATASQ